VSRIAKKEMIEGMYVALKLKPQRQQQAVLGLAARLSLVGGRRESTFDA
jgi:hypothetical protein